MIELARSENDDVAFLQLTQWIVNGAISALNAREVYLVRVDNWFDFKWLGFWSSWGRERELKELCVPPFNPNRVRSENRYIWDENSSRVHSAVHNDHLHLRQPGRRVTHGRPLERFSKSAAFIWYSGNTVTNQDGSVMLYLTGAEGYAWYASFMKNGQWKHNDEFRIGRA
jgi:hypothetical protein